MTIRFLHPDYLKLFYLLLAVAPCWLYFLYVKRRTRKDLGVGRALTRISRLASLRKDLARAILINLVMAGLVLALAHPQRVQEQKVPQPGALDVVFLLDTSPSMRAEDIFPSRLARALEVMASFVRAKSAQDRIGLVSFAGTSMVVSYLTQDSGNILYYLDYLKNDASLNHGTNIGLGLRNGLAVVDKEKELLRDTAQHKKIFILLSDGEDNGTDLNAAIAEVKKQAIKVHTVGVGSRDGAPIPMGQEAGGRVYLADDQGQRIISRFDEHNLGWIADTTGGKFYRSFSGLELENAFAQIVIKEREITGFKKIVEYQDLHHSVLLAAAGIFLLALLL